MSEVETVLDTLHDGLAFDYYTTALTCLYFYDYFLTLPDEMEYVWKKRKTLVSYLFFANRYFPFFHRIWSIFPEHYAGYTQHVCNGSAFIHVMAFTLITWLAQLVLTSRIYAVSGKNWWITLVLLFLSTVQLSLGCWQSAPTGNGAPPIRVVPGLDLQFCVPSRHRVHEIANATMSIPFDTLVFSLTIYFARKQGATYWSLTQTPSIFHTLFRDGAIYFLFILINHVVFTFTLLLGRSLAQMIPPIRMTAYIPIAISRLILSLRKAASEGDGLVFYSRSRNWFKKASLHLSTEGGVGGASHTHTTPVPLQETSS